MRLETTNNIIIYIYKFIQVYIYIYIYIYTIIKTQKGIYVMGTFLGAVLSIYTRWQHLFLGQVNLYVQSLTLSSMAQQNANKIKTTIKKYNINEYSTSSDLLLLFRIKLCFREALVATPCRSQH